jgi:3-hydroxyacyl-CoA dehydrogenase
MEELVKQNRLGIKNKHGFFDYTVPGESDSPISNSNNVSDIYRKKVKERLWFYYLRSVEAVLKSGVCSKEELSFHIKDYMGIDSDPFNLFKV